MIYKQIQFRILVMDDIKLILSDVNSNKITIDMNKNDLENLSPYFNNLLNFGKEKNQSEIIVKVDDVLIALNVIGKYYLSEWRYIFKTLQCQNYFNMDVDINKLYDLVVPPEGFDMLLKIIDELNCPLDDKLKATIKKNIPNDYDLNNLSDEFVKELIPKQKKYILTSYCESNVIVWDIFSDKPLKTKITSVENICGLTVYSNPLQDSALSNPSTKENNQVIVSFDEKIKLWDMTGKLLVTLDGITVCEDDHLVFSPNGQIIASVEPSYHIIKLWEVLTGKLFHTLVGHTNTINCMAFSPNGKIIASGSWDKNIKLWEVSTGQLLNTITGHTCPIYQLAFSPATPFGYADNLKIVSSNAKSLQLWDVTTNKFLNDFGRHANQIFHIAFSPNGARKKCS
jgi:WD40 repeat protein